MQYLLRRFSLAVSALAFASIVGCVSYNARPIPATSPTRQLVGKSLRVTKKDGTRIEFESAYVEGDSLSGKIGESAQLVSIPLSSIAMLEDRGISAGKTIGIIGVVYAVAALVALVGLLSVLGSWN